MAYVVDGAEWQFSGWSAEKITKAIENILQIIDQAGGRGEEVWIGDDLQTRPVFKEFDLWSLRNPDSPIKLHPDIWQELAAWLLKAPCYLDADENWPDGIDEVFVEIDQSEPNENADAAWVHHCVRSGKTVACLGFNRHGPLHTRTALGVTTVHWINDEESRRNFWRNAIQIQGDNAETFKRLAPSAYPDLYFYDGIWRGLRDLSKPYTSLSVQLHNFLSKLNDHGKWAFTFPPPGLNLDDLPGPDLSERPSRQIVERRFKTLNLAISPENPDVFGDRTSREARQINVQGKTLYCEWHGKFEKHIDRIHIHAPIAESGNRVVIAILHKHLPLPG